MSEISANAQVFQEKARGQGDYAQVFSKQKNESSCKEIADLPRNSGVFQILR